MGDTNLAQAISATNDSGLTGEGTIYYDIRFTAYCRDTEMKILMNLEAQKTSDVNKLGYHLENRIVFYLARMISNKGDVQRLYKDRTGYSKFIARLVKTVMNVSLCYVLSYPVVA